MGTFSAVCKGVGPLHTRLLSHTNGVGSKPGNREMHVLVEMSRVTGDYNFNLFLFFIYLNFLKKTTTTKTTTTKHIGAKDSAVVRVRNPMRGSCQLLTVGCWFTPSNNGNWPPYTT